MSEPNAQWLLNPISEREMIAEQRERRRGRWIGWTIAATMVALYPFIFNGLGYQFVLLIYVSATLVIIGNAGQRRDRIQTVAASRRKSFEDSFGAVDGWPVRVTVYQGATPTGSDDGMIWFEDGRLFFVGERTSFGLTPSQIGGEMREAWLRYGKGPSKLLRLRARTTAGVVGLGIDPLSFNGEVLLVPRSIVDLPVAISNWLKVPGESQGQLPPTSLGPDAPSHGKLLANFLCVTLLWSLLFGGAAWIGLQIGVVFAPHFIFIVVASIAFWKDLWDPRRSWQAITDRRRLDRGHP